MDTHDNIAVWSSKFQKKTLEETKTTNYMNMTCAESFHFSQINLEALIFYFFNAHNPTAWRQSHLWVRPGAGQLGYPCTMTLVVVWWKGQFLVSIATKGWCSWHFTYAVVIPGSQTLIFFHSHMHRHSCLTWLCSILFLIMYTTALNSILFTKLFF